MRHTQYDRTRRKLYAALALGLASLLLSSHQNDALSQPQPASNDDVQQEDARQAVLITIKLPIAAGIEERVKATIERALPKGQGDSRPVVVFEFSATDEATSPDSSFGPAYELASLLTSEKLSGVETVAFLPGSVTGHAVLPVMACEQIIVTDAARLGEAGINEDVVKATHRAAYEEIAKARATVKAPIALAMLDRDVSLHSVEMPEGGTRFATSDELPELRGDSSTLSEAGDLAIFTADELRDHGIATHIVEDRVALASAIGVRPADLQGTISQDGWDGILVELRGNLNANNVDDAVRSLLNPKEEFNFVCVMIDSPGGTPQGAMRLATELSAFDSEQVRTIAFINEQALSTAGVVAMACDEIVMHPNAKIGGQGEPYIGERQKENLLKGIKQIAGDKGRDWSMMASMIDADLRVYRYTHPAQPSRLFCEDELAEQVDKEAWTQGDQVKTRRGITAADAQSLRIVRQTATDLPALMSLYGVEDELRKVEEPWLVRNLENLASQRWFARTLLFVAFFALISEFSSPGLSAPGFVAALCFLLFFWTQFLNGNATWLEPLLFVGGIICIALEILVIPGFGIFGIGGGLMVIASIVLASQTFIIPRNSYQYEQLPNSIFMPVWALGGGFVAMVILRKYLADTPVLNRMLLRPMAPEEIEERSVREQLVSWSHLHGKSGKTTTQLTPSGKAMFGDDVVSVISDGELIEKGETVYVIEVQGSRVVVASSPDGLRNMA